VVVSQEESKARYILGEGIGQDNSKYISRANYSSCGQVDKG